MFHDWIEVTKKNEKGKIDSCNALRATTPLPDFHRGHEQEIERFAGVSQRFPRLNGERGDLERRWIEGRGDASSARPRFNSSLENIFHGVM